MKAVCNTHYQAYEVSDGCPWCAPKAVHAVKSTTWDKVEYFVGPWHFGRVDAIHKNDYVVCVKFKADRDLPAGRYTVRFLDGDALDVYEVERPFMTIRQNDLVTFTFILSGAGVQVTHQTVTPDSV